jgi:hypothetical protein
VEYLDLVSLRKSWITVPALVSIPNSTTSLKTIQQIRFVNDNRNLYRIEAAVNQAKKRIPFDWNKCSNHGFRIAVGTVDGNIKHLASEMATRNH